MWAGARILVTFGVRLETRSHPIQALESVPAKIQYANWSAINYIINHKPSGVSYKVIQAVIWHYDGAPDGYPNPAPPGAPLEPYSHSDYDALLSIVEANAGNTYVPGNTGVYAVILWQKENNQVIFVEGQMNERVPPPPVPEFPSVALPAGMVIGVVGLVYFVKGREN